MKKCKKCGGFKDEKGYCSECRHIHYLSKTPNRKRVRSKRSVCGNGVNKIYLQNGQSTLVDAEDYMAVNKYIWYEDSKGYVRTSDRSATTQMHRLIMNAKKDQFVDHISGDILDNRRSNLRFCSNAENVSHRVKLAKNNTSGAHGVSWSRRDKKWQATICSNKHIFHLGYFDNIEDAIAARKKAEEKYFGEFAPLV